MMLASFRKARFVALTALPLWVGCGGQDSFDLKGSLPEDKAVEIAVPGSGDDGQALLGARSEFYLTTYNTSRGINGFVKGVLELVRKISSETPTKKEGNTYTWGPSEPKGLENIQYRFQATRLEEKHYTFHLDGRTKGSTAESDYKIIFDGDVTKGAVQGTKGHGKLNLYFDAAQALNQNTCISSKDLLEGTAKIAFAADVEPKTITVDFTDFRNKCDGETVKRAPAKYSYSEAKDGAGNFQFVAHGNIHKAAENKPLIEEFRMRSRWNGTGKGRSDVTLSEGEIPDDMSKAVPPIMGNAVQVTECWDEQFNVSYQETLPSDMPEDFKNKVRPTQGTPSACQYTEAQLPEDI